MLAKLAELISHADWCKKIPSVEYALNNTIHATTKQIPSKLLFGVIQRGQLVDELTEYLDEKQPFVPETLEDLRSAALKNIEAHQKYTADYFAKHSRPAKTFEQGEYVVIRNVDTTLGTNRKLIPTYRGPYRIHKVLIHDRYVVRDVENCPITRLPYDGLIEANRMRKWLLSYSSDQLNSHDSSNTNSLSSSDQMPTDEMPTDDMPTDEMPTDEMPNAEMTNVETSDSEYEDYEELTNDSTRFPSEPP